jgi:midasin
MYTTDRNFVVIGAMNPSGDWGKKELTPALRSRFTEIYVQNPLTQLEEIRFIVGKFFDEDTYVRVLSEVFE